LSEKIHGRARHREADCLIAADIANTMKRMYEAEEGDMVKPSPGSNGRPRKERSTTIPYRGNGGGGAPPIDSQGGGTGYLATYERLRTAGNNGVQLPIKEYTGGKLVGTEMLYLDGKFDTADGKAIFKSSPWPGLPKVVADQKAKHKFWINNGRVNEVWQTGYHDMYNEFIRNRWPMAFVEVNPNDAMSMSVASGDVVEIYNDYGTSYAMAYLEPSIKPNQTFMQFGYFNGIVGDVVTHGPTATLCPTTRGLGQHPPGWHRC